MIFAEASPLIVNLAPTGMVPTRSLSPHVPLQPAEIVQNVLECAKLGITSVHIHARDENGKPTHSKNVYAKIISGIREKRADLIICVSCSGRGGVSLEERTDVLQLDGDLRPDMASLTLSSLNFIDQASINEPTLVLELARRMRDRGIQPELEIFDLGMVNIVKTLMRRNHIVSPCYANILLGNIATAQATLIEIAALTSSLPREVLFSLAGIGVNQLPVTAIAIATAPGVRIGLEDNLWLDRERELLATNQCLVSRIGEICDALNRRVMTPNELRTKLGLQRF